MSTKKGKKAMPTKYSAIGSTVVPLAQQMSQRSNTPKKDAPSSTDNFFDDIMGEWDTPNSNPVPTQSQPPNKTQIIGIHKQGDDVSSTTSPSLSFTPTPPPNATHPKTDPTSSNKDRSIYILDTKPKPSTAPIPSKPSQIPENSNYSRSIFDDIITEEPIRSSNENIDINKIAAADDTIRNDPNYLPPPDEHTLSPPNGIQREESDDSDDEELKEPDQPSTPNINPWAHLNKTISPKITEAPIEEDDETENRVFLRHDADEPEEKMYKRKTMDNEKQEWVKRVCYCMIFVLGIGVGVLLTIALIRHQAIDANYLFNTPAIETEADDVIQTEINSHNDTINNNHHIMQRHHPNHHRDSDESQLILEVKGHDTPSPTISPTKSPVSTDTPTVSPTAKPTANPTHSPSKRSTTLAPTKNPIKPPTVSPITSVLSHLDNTNKTVSKEGENVTESTTLSPTKQGVKPEQKDETPSSTESTEKQNITISSSSASIQNKNGTEEAVHLTSKSPDINHQNTEHNVQINNTNTAIEAPPQSTLPIQSISNKTEGYSVPRIIGKRTTTKSNSDSQDQTDAVSTSIRPLCDVVPTNQCTANKHKPLPLPFDKPLSAQLRCHQNTCNSPPSLPGQRIISGETFEAGKTILDIQHEIPTKCRTKHMESIKVHRDGYNNNEDWKYCLRISNDDTLLKYPILHITFSIIDFDLERGFDNLFFTTQFNEIYDDYAEVWTGNWSTLHRFEPNTWYQNFWMTSAEPNAFAEFCLRLQSDESNVGKGFVGEFSITREIGTWGEWSTCHAHSARSNLGNGACGVGVHSRMSQCPSEIQLQQKKPANSRFDWSNGTHSCINQFSNYPVNKYCIVADCGTIDNLKENPDMDETTAKYIFNGASRIDPQYADPFKITMNVGRKGRDLNLYKLKEDLQSEIDAILSRYSLPSQALFAEVLDYKWPIQFDKLGVRLLSSLALGRVFTFVTTGSSNTAGHDNLFMSAYPMQLQSLMQVIWNKYSVYGGAFRVRNQAVGGHLGTVKQGPCISALIGTYDKRVDMVSWESFMNDGSHIVPLYEEIWLRNILSTYNVTHSQPFITCISTGEGTQAGCTVSGRFVFNSFMRYYYRNTGVANYFGQHVCQSSSICAADGEDELDENGEAIPCWDRAVNEACRASHISWHPSPHRHRVMAETFAVNFMRSAINAIDRLYDSMQNIETLSSYELACLLEQNQNQNDTQSDANHAVFERPITEVHTDCGELCRNAMWCAISFWPTPKHNQLHRYFVDNNGWFNNDTIDLPVDPLIMRNGGRAPIDHKAQWSVDKAKMGASLEMMVKVPLRYIMIVYPQGTSRTKIKTYFEAFDLIVDGQTKECEAAPYDKEITSFCLLDCGKPGKYKLNIKLVRTNDALNTLKQYSIDEIAGI
eukprot:273279_1